jgi:hypothetical protein
MIYLNESILYTESDVIVYPFVPDLEIPSGSLHEAIAVIVGDEYRARYNNAIRSGKIQRGGVYVQYVRTGDWAGRWTIGIPMFLGSMKFTDLRQSIVTAISAFRKTESDAMAVQLPMVPCDWDENLQEAVWQFVEYSMVNAIPDQKVREIQVYTETYERIDEEDEPVSEERELIEEYLKLEEQADEVADC